jgi:hypothetical protein
MMWLLVETEGIMKVEMMEVEVTEVMEMVVVVEEVVVVVVAVVVGGGNSLPPAGPLLQRWVHRVGTVTCSYVVMVRLP